MILYIVLGLHFIDFFLIWIISFLVPALGLNCSHFSKTFSSMAGYLLRLALLFQYSFPSKATSLHCVPWFWYVVLTLSFDSWNYLIPSLISSVIC